MYVTESAGGIVSVSIIIVYRRKARDNHFTLIMEIKKRSSVSMMVKPLMFYVPNLLTLARIAMVPWLIVLLQREEYTLSLLVFITAGITDALDGYIAKRFNASTNLGAILDPLADKALLVSSYLMLSLLEIIPFWLMIVVVFRDIVIIGGYLIMFLLYGAIKMEPLKISKVNTVSQILFIIVALASAAFAFNIDLILQLLGYGVLVTSVWSGSAYVFIWSLRTMDNPDQFKADKE